MDDFQTHLKFRGGPVAMAVLAVAFAAVFLTRFVPAFFPDYSGLGAMPRVAREALGCLDHETAEIGAAIRREADDTDVPPGRGARAFAEAHARGMAAAGRIEYMQGCAARLAETFPRMAEEGGVTDSVEAIGEALVEVYGAKAAFLAAAYGVPPAPEAEVKAARLALSGSSKRAESVTAGFSLWVADQVAMP